MDNQKAYLGNQSIDFAFLGELQIYPKDGFPTPTPTPTPTATPTPTPTPTSTPTPTPCPLTVSLTSAQRILPGNVIQMSGNAFSCTGRGFQVSEYPNFIASRTVPASGLTGPMSASTDWGLGFPAYVRAYSTGDGNTIYSNSITVN
jgi:hypothetical protein